MSHVSVFTVPATVLLYNGGINPAEGVTDRAGDYYILGGAEIKIKPQDYYLLKSLQVLGWPK